MKNSGCTISVYTSQYICKKVNLPFLPFPCICCVLVLHFYFPGLTVETFSRDPFLCSCVEKLFKKCHLLFKKEEDFWSMMMSIINNVIKTSNKPDESSTSSSLFYFKSINIAIAFSWWWIQRMVKCF